jgi:hypothetical protein
VRIRYSKRFSALLSLISAVAALGFAQIRSGSIVGQVVDQSGAPVPDALITVLALETNIKSETLTNVSGQYTVPYLPPGQYTVAVARKGFVTATTSKIEVGTAQTVRADVRLDVGSVTTSVEVNASAQGLQTESAAVQNSVAERVISTIPNITHNPYYYATLQPGVAARAAANDTQTVRAFGVGQEARRQFSAISINGGLSFTNEVLLDGLSVVGATFNEANVVPNPDAVLEVRTSVNNYSAEYGRGQGVISVTTKGGSNEFHGSASDRFRNEALNANRFGNNQLRIPRAPFKVNTYAGSFGGPIKKNRLFVFVSYEGLQHSQSLDYLATIPTALERQGDFSQTLVNVSGRPTPLQLFDPFNVTQLQPDVYQRAAVPNARIPNPDPYIVKMMSNYPLPNRTPDDVYNTNNYYRRGSQDYSRNTMNSRLDDRWGRHSLYWAGGIHQGSVTGTGSWGPDNQFQSDLPSGSAGSGLGTSVTDMNFYAALGDTVVLSPTLVLDVRYGITRVNSTNQMAQYNNFDYDQFGIPKEIQAINTVPGAPPVGDWGTWTNIEATGPHLWMHTTSHDMVPSLTKIIDRWTIKVGGEYRVALSNFDSGKRGIDIGSGTSVVQPIASYSLQMINAGGTPIGTVTPEKAGYGPASMLLGAGQIGIWTSAGWVPLTLAQKYGAVYTQADWRATSRLTLNLGLRWDVQPGATDRFNQICAFDGTGTNPYGQGAVACAGTKGYSRNIYNTEWHNFGPRTGIAYRLTDSFVIRAGYALTYLPSNTGFRSTPFDWAQDSFGAFTNSNPYGTSPSGTLVGRWNSPTVNPITPAFGTDYTNPGFYGGLRLQKFDRFFPTQSAQQWNFFIEKRFGSEWLISAGYAASKGSHLLFSRIPLTDKEFIPQPVLDSWRQGYIQANGLTNPGTQQIPNPFQPVGKPLIPFNAQYGQSTITPESVAIPYPLFASNQLQKDIGWSNYNSLVVHVEHRFSKGFLASGSYTWSKSLDFSESEANAGSYMDTGDIFQDAGSWLDLRNLRNNYAASYFDIPHRAVITFLYELPFGQGRALSTSSRIINGVVGGWRTGGAATFQSGSPLAITGASTGALNKRPNRVSGVPVELPQDLQHWYDGKTTVTLPDGRKYTPCANCYLKYNPNAFQGNVVTTPNGSIVNDVYWWGTAAQRYADIRGTGINNWNLSLERSFRFKERLSMEFAAQATNAFNHTQFKPAMTMALGNQSILANSPLGLQPGQGQSSNFGTRGNATYDPRQVELRLRVSF